MKSIVVSNNDNIIIAISDYAKATEYGINLNGGDIIYRRDLSVFTFEDDQFPDNISINKWCYSEDEGFYPNKAYVRNVGIEDVARSLIELAQDKYPIIDRDICTVDEYRQYTRKVISITCNSAIENGVDVFLDDAEETEHFSLTLADQTNIETIMSIIAPIKEINHVLYHQDNGLCKKYSRKDFFKIFIISSMHKLFHTTYTNALFMMLKGCDSKHEIDQVFYGAIPMNINEIVVNMKEFMAPVINHYSDEEISIDIDEYISTMMSSVQNI